MRVRGCSHLWPDAQNGVNWSAGLKASADPEAHRAQQVKSSTKKQKNTTDRVQKRYYKFNIYTVLANKQLENNAAHLVDEWYDSKLQAVGHVGWY